MADDVPPETPWHPGENAFYVAIRGASAEEITAHREILCEGASVLQRLGASTTPIGGRSVRSPSYADRAVRCRTGPPSRGAVP